MSPFGRSRGLQRRGVQRPDAAGGRAIAAKSVHGRARHCRVLGDQRAPRAPPRPRTQDPPSQGREPAALRHRRSRCLDGHPPEGSCARGQSSDAADTPTLADRLTLPANWSRLGRQVETLARTRGDQRIEPAVLAAGGAIGKRRGGHPRRHPGRSAWTNGLAVPASPRFGGYRKEITCGPVADIGDRIDDDELGAAGLVGQDVRRAATRGGRQLALADQPRHVRFVKCRAARTPC